MRKVKSGSQFRKDLKRYKNDTAKLEKLYDIVGFWNVAKIYLKSLNRICFREIMQGTWMSCGK